VPEQTFPDRDIELMVNGQRHSRRVPVWRLLREFVRDDLGLTGTKIGCEDGMCGACSVMVNGEVVKSCLLLAAEADGQEVTTVEGLSKPGEALSSVQQAMIDHFGFQCGFCTPGFIMTMTALLSRAADGEHFDERTAREVLVGNICRCTGYTKIVEAFLAAQGSMGESQESTADG
jgi:aerobic carbon-monoxide dehydrogenase small subunit